MDNNFSFYVHIFIRSFRKYLIFSLYSWKMKNLFYLSLRHANEYNEIKTCQFKLLRVPYIKCGQEILYTYTIIGYTAKVYIIFWPHLRLHTGSVLHFKIGTDFAQRRQNKWNHYLWMWGYQLDSCYFKDFIVQPLLKLHCKSQIRVSYFCSLYTLILIPSPVSQKCLQ